MKQCCIYLKSLPVDAVAIPEYPNYFATPAGQIYSQWGRVKQRRYSSNGCGYPICRIRHVSGVVTTAIVHRVIAKMFVPGDQTLTVNHIDMVKTNCAASNIEWITLSENHLKGRILKPKWGASNTGRFSLPLIAVNPETGVKTLFDSGKDAALWVGNAKASGNISKACVHGRLAYGFYWSKAAKHAKAG
jgi:hypothetical protein